jgi:hypothetical protein
LLAIFNVWAFGILFLAFVSYFDIRIFGGNVGSQGGIRSVCLFTQEGYWELANDHCKEN